MGRSDVLAVVVVPRSEYRNLSTHRTDGRGRRRTDSSSPAYPPVRRGYCSICSSVTGRTQSSTPRPVRNESIEHLALLVTNCLAMLDSLLYDPLRDRLDGLGITADDFPMTVSPVTSSGVSDTTSSRMAKPSK